MASPHHIEVWRPPALADVGAQWCHEVQADMPPHFHRGFQLALLEAGEVDVKVGGDSHRARADDLILFNAGEPHQLAAVAGVPVSARIVEVGPERMEKALGDVVPCFGTECTHDAALADLLRDVHDRIARGDPGDEAGDLLDEVICQAVASYGQRVDGPRSVSDRRLERARAFLAEDFDARVTLDQLAEEVGVSKFGLVRSFRARFGLPPMTYRLQLRLEQAKEMLGAGTSPAEVACATGFSDQAHLTRHFRRLTLMTPGAYARQIRGG